MFYCFFESSDHKQKEICFFATEDRLNEYLKYVPLTDYNVWSGKITCEKESNDYIKLVYQSDDETEEDEDTEGYPDTDLEAEYEIDLG